MQPLMITNLLRGYLYEINFVYRRLPAVLERVGMTSAVHRWGGFLKDQVGLIRGQQNALGDVVAMWGEGMRPCACAEVDELLNEIHHALVAKGDHIAMERRVHEVFMALRKVVLARLDEGVQLARKLGEPELAQRLETLFADERAQDDQLTETWVVGSERP